MSDDRITPSDWEAYLEQLANLTPGRSAAYNTSPDVATPTTAKWFTERGVQNIGAAKALAQMAGSPYLLNILQAPMGNALHAGLSAFRELVEGRGGTVVVLSALVTQIKQASSRAVGSRYLTLADWSALPDAQWDKGTVVLVYDAQHAEYSDRDRLRMLDLVESAAAQTAKLILVGDDRTTEPSEYGIFRNSLIREDGPAYYEFPTI